MHKIAILASHNGSGYDAIYQAIQNNEIFAQIACVISNNSNANILQKAQLHQIPTFLVNSKTEIDPDKKINALLKEYKVDLVFLSGYMKKVPLSIIKCFSIVNSHPSLLPKFGGKGMYGSFVHKAVIDAGEDESGVSIHRVSEVYDQGEILLQKRLRLSPHETVKSLETKIKALEAIAIVEGINLCLK